MAPEADEIQCQRDLLTIHRQTLAHYLSQQAMLGIAHMPPGIAHGIREARHHIRMIKETLRAWGIDVPDMPNDILHEPPPGADPGAVLPSSMRTGIEWYCKKPWSGLGLSPTCTITVQESGFSVTKRLLWEAWVFVPLPAETPYLLTVSRPSDPLSLKAKTTCTLRSGEVKRFVYTSPKLAILAGTITITES